MTKLGRPSIWDQYGEQMQQMYEQDHLSRGEIARIIGTSVQSVTRVLTRRGVAFDDRPALTRHLRTPEEQAVINAKVSAGRTGKGTGPRKPVEVRTCENKSCGCQFEYHAGQTGERFCSRSCRNEYASFVNKKAAKDAYELDPRRCPCGTPIDFEHRHTRQFCSREHRMEYQAKRQKDPANWATFNCLNCGTEVTRPKNYGGSMVQKYCSNECSAKHNRTKQHIVVEDAVVLDSPYEALFYGLCRFWKIPIERADRSMAVSFTKDVQEVREDDAIDGYDLVDGLGSDRITGEVTCWYCPDFRIIIPHLGLDLWVEVKGFEDEDDRARYDAWRARGHVLLVVHREELDTLREASRDAQFVARLKAIENRRLLDGSGAGSQLQLLLLS